MTEDESQFHKRVGENLFSIIEKHLSKKKGWSDKRNIDLSKYCIIRIINSCFFENDNRLKYSQYMNKIKRCSYLCEELDNLIFDNKYNEWCLPEVIELSARTDLVDMIDINLLKDNLMVLKTAFDLAVKTTESDNYPKKLKKLYSIIDNVGIIFRGIDFEIEDVSVKSKIKSELGSSNHEGPFLLVLLDVIKELNSYGCIIHESEDTEELKRRVKRRLNKIKDYDGVPISKQQKTRIAKEIAARNGLEISLKDKRLKLIMFYNKLGFSYQ